MCKLKKYVKMMLCIGLSAAMIFADTPMSVFAQETETVTQDSEPELEEQKEISTEDGVTEKETKEAETVVKTEENVAEQDEKTDSEKEAITDEAETKTEQPMTTETALETETEELSTKAAEAESEAEESTQEELSAGTDIAQGVYKDITWAIDADGKLTVEGTGDFSDDTGESRAPWSGNSEDIKTAEIKVSSMTNASYMFAGCGKLTSLDVSGFDTIKVTDMRCMFQGCSGLESLDLSGFDMSKVTSVDSMFQGCEKLSSIRTPYNVKVSVPLPTGEWYDMNGIKYTELPQDFSDSFLLTEGVFSDTDIAHGGYKKITWVIDADGKLTVEGTGDFSDDLGSGRAPWTSYAGDIKSAEIKVSGMTNADYMFYCCDELARLNLSGFDTTKITSMSNMFAGCSRLSSLDVSGFDTSNVTDMSNMFGVCGRLSSLDVSGFNTSNVTSMSDMFSGCIGLSSLDVSGFNTTNVTDMSGMFNMSDMEGNSRLSSLDVSGFDTSNVTSMSDMFRDCIELTSLDVSGFDTSNVTSMSGMFNMSGTDGSGKLSSLDVSGFDTTNVTNMSNMFFNCGRLSSLDVSGFNTTKVTDMSSMFNYCNKLTSLDVSGFNTSNVTNMYCMFQECEELTNLDVSSFNTTKVTNMSWMFSGCYKLSSLDVSSFDTIKVTDMRCMFQACYELERLDLSSFDMSKVTGVDSMLHGCEKLSSIRTPYNVKKSVPLPTGEWYDMDGIKYTELPQDFPDSFLLTEGVFSDTDIAHGGYKKIIWVIDADGKLTVEGTGDFSDDLGSGRAPWTSYAGNIKSAEIKVSGMTNADYMFYCCDELTRLYLSGFDTSNVTSMSNMFAGCSRLSSLDVSGFDTSNVTDMSNMFGVCGRLTSLDVSGFNTSNVTDMSDMFSGCIGLSSLDVSGFNTSNVTNMSGMFNMSDMEGNSRLSSLDVSGFNTTKVTDMSEMFRGCNELSSLDLSGFDTTNVTDMSGMFNMNGTDSSGKLSSLDVSGFDTTNVTNMRDMFFNCGSLSSLDLSSFNTTNVTDMSGMFSYCNKLSSLDLSSFNTSKVTNMYCMFDECEGLTSLNVSSFNTSKVTDMSRMFAFCGMESLDLSSFDTSNVTSMTQMFAFCGMESLDLSGFDTSKVTSMKSMFQTCEALKSLDVSGFDTIKVTNMSFMFQGCSELESLDLSSFDMSKVTSVNQMFDYCKKLTLLRTPYNVKNTDSLPSGDWYDIDGNKYTWLPKELPNSILLAKGQRPTPVAEHITAVKQKTVYSVGDTVNIDDLTVKYYRSDGTVKTLTNKEYTTNASSLDMTTAGKKILTITYMVGSKPLTAEITLTVNKTGGSGGGDGDNGEETDDFPVAWEYPANLKVERITLTADNIEVKAKNRIYDGTPYTPDVKVTVTDSKGKKTVLVDGTDYTVKYSNNIKAGEGTVTIKGNGTYTGTLTKTFTISPKPIKKLKTVAGGIIASENASSIKPQDLPICVYDGTKKLAYDVDYTLTITKGDATKKGKLEVAVSAHDGSNYTGTGKDAAKATVTVYEATGKNFKGIINSDDVAFETASDASQTYTGKALKPVFKVTVNNTELGKKEFSVKYTNNKEAGTAYATITGKGGYVGSVVKTFEITPVAESSGFTLKKEIKTPTYNGKLQKPKVTIVSGNKTLKAGKDYQIAYSNNLHATPENAADKDKAKITITGIGNYEGMKGTFYFEINRLEIKKASVKGTEYDLDVTYAKHKLVENHDYEITNAELSPNGKKVNITLTGKGDFTGTVTKSVNAEK